MASRWYACVFGGVVCDVYLIQISIGFDTLADKLEIEHSGPTLACDGDRHTYASGREGGWFASRNPLQMTYLDN